MLTSSLTAVLDVKLTVFTKSLKSCVAKPFSSHWWLCRLETIINKILSGLGQGFSLHLAALPAPWVLSGPRSCREKPTTVSSPPALMDGRRRTEGMMLWSCSH